MKHRRIEHNTTDRGPVREMQRKKDIEGVSLSGRSNRGMRDRDGSVYEKEKRTSKNRAFFFACLNCIKSKGPRRFRYR